MQSNLSTKKKDGIKEMQSQKKEHKKNFLDNLPCHILPLRKLRPEYSHVLLKELMPSLLNYHQIKHIREVLIPPPNLVPSILIFLRDRLQTLYYNHLVPILLDFWLLD